MPPLSTGTDEIKMMFDTAQQAISFTSFKNLINGQLQGSAVRAKGLDPSTGEALWEVPVRRKEDVDEAVSAANKSFPGWVGTPWKLRQNLLAKVRVALLAFQKEMTALLVKEAGKPVNVSSQERVKLTI